MKRKASISLIPLSSIITQGNVRSTIDPQSLVELAESIRTQGLLQPVTLVAGQEPDTYGILMGHRRVAAFRMLSEKHQGRFLAIPAIIVLSMEDDSIEEVQLVENLQREGLSARDIQAGMRVLKEKGLSHKDIALRIGKTEGYVRNVFTALNTMERNPEVQELVNDHEQLTLTDIQEVQGLEPWTQVALLRERVSGRIPTVKALRERVAQQKASDASTDKKIKKLRPLDKMVTIRGGTLTFHTGKIHVESLDSQEKQRLKMSLEAIIQKLH